MTQQWHQYGLPLWQLDTYLPMNQPDSMFETPHIVRPIVSPIILMTGTTMRLPEGERIYIHGNLHLVIWYSTHTISAPPLSSIHPPSSLTPSLPPSLPSSPVVQRIPPMSVGRKKGGWSLAIFTTNPTSQIPIHRTHWKNIPGEREREGAEGRERVTTHIVR